MLGALFAAGWLAAGCPNDGGAVLGRAGVLPALGRHGIPPLPTETVTMEIGEVRAFRLTTTAPGALAVAPIAIAARGPAALNLSAAGASTFFEALFAQGVDCIDETSGSASTACLVDRARGMPYWFAVNYFGAPETYREADDFALSAAVEGPSSYTLGVFAEGVGSATVLLSLTAPPALGLCRSDPYRMGVGLLWEGEADLDIRVVDPSFEIVDLVNPMSRDGAAFSGDAARGDVGEFVYWGAEAVASPGPYTVLVDRFAGDAAEFAVEVCAGRLSLRGQGSFAAPEAGRAFAESAALAFLVDEDGRLRP